MTATTAAKGFAGLLAAGLVLIGCGAQPQAVGSRTPIASQSRTPSPSPSSQGCLDRSVLGSATTGQTNAQSAAQSSGVTGAIAGHVTTPSEVIFPHLVYAISTNGASHGAYSTETLWNQSGYTILDVNPGAYFVYATNRLLECTPDGNVNGALYSTYVTCGLGTTCSTHTPIAVTVVSNKTTANIDPIDYYSSNPEVPPPPKAIVPQDPQLQKPASAYSTARDAALATVLQQDAVTVVDNMTACPTNHACMSLGTEHDGTGAAYFVGAGGSNGDVMACGIYVVHTANGWHGLRRQCSVGAVFPAQGQSGQVVLGIGPPGQCANVRQQPSTKSTVVGCLTAGTQFTVDEGPVYAPMPSMDGVWWHIAGRGWMADDYLHAF